MRIYHFIFISIFTFAISSCKSKTEILADKYDVSEGTVEQCLLWFSDEAEEDALSVVSKEQWFFGLFGPSCKELADESRQYNSQKIFFDARALKLTTDQYIEYKAKQIENLTGVNKEKAREWLKKSNVPFDESLIDDVIWYFCNSDWTSCRNTNAIAKQLKYRAWRGSTAITSDLASDWKSSAYPKKLATAYAFLESQAEPIVGKVFLISDDSLKPFVIDMVICADRKYALEPSNAISSVFNFCFKNDTSSFQDSLISAKEAHEKERKAKRSAMSQQDYVDRMAEAEWNQTHSPDSIRDHSAVKRLQSLIDAGY